MKSEVAEHSGVPKNACIFGVEETSRSGRSPRACLVGDDSVADGDVWRVESGAVEKKCEEWRVESGVTQLFSSTVLVGAGERREFCVLQAERVLEADVEISFVLEEGAEASVTVLLLGGGAVRVHTRAELNGDNSVYTERVATLQMDGDRVDLDLEAMHRGRNTHSEMRTLSVLGTGAEKSLRGTIDFKRGSKGSTGAETEEVLYLGGDCVSRTVPLILCQEEDVDGTHGSTMSRLGEDERFYLLSRGIDAQNAVNLVARARLQSLCTGCAEAEAAVEDRLGHGKSGE